MAMLNNQNGIYIYIPLYSIEISQNPMKSTSGRLVTHEIRAWYRVGGSPRSRVHGRHGHGWHLTCREAPKMLGFHRVLIWFSKVVW